MESNADRLASIRIVLVEPSHPGNIGACARAMKNMGLSDLALVAPLQFPHADASARAAGADDVLERASVYASLPEALAECTSVLGCSARDRGIAIQALSPREAAQEMLQDSAGGDRVALLFGRERTGLTNAELATCRARVAIPANPEFASLNLGQAVQVLTYELRVANESLSTVISGGVRQAAPSQEQEGLFSHFAETLDQLQFHKGRNPDAALTKLRRLFLRARLDTKEIRLLRGILAEAQFWVRAAGKR